MSSNSFQHLNFEDQDTFEIPRAFLSSFSTDDSTTRSANIDSLPSQDVGQFDSQVVADLVEMMSSVGMSLQHIAAVHWLLEPADV
jgi:hypothetical protein